MNYYYITGYLLEKLKKDYPVCATLTVESFKIEDKVIRVETCNEIQLEQLRQLRAQIEDMFNDVGIDKNFDFYIDEENDVFKDIKEEMEAYEPVEIDLSLIQSQINRRQNKIIIRIIIVKKMQESI